MPGSLPTGALLSKLSSLSCTAAPDVPSALPAGFVPSVPSAGSASSASLSGAASSAPAADAVSSVPAAGSVFSVPEAELEAATAGAAAWVLWPAGFFTVLSDGSRKLNQSSAKQRTASAMPQAVRPAFFRLFAASPVPSEPLSAGAFSVTLPAFREMAFWGQQSMHRAQWMHSWSPTRFTSMPHERTQAPHPLHFPVSTFTPTRQNRLNSP